LKIHNGTALIALALVAAACDSRSSASLDTDAQMASYAVGRDIGGSLQPAAGHLDLDAFARGVEDALAGRDPAIPEMEMQGALMRFSEQIQASMQEGQADLAAQNRLEGEQYMEVNRANPNVTTTASGLQWEVLEAGSGRRPGPEDEVTIHYRGILVDGTQFDSSYDRGEPTTFAVAGVIEGFEEALQLMPVGSKYRFVIPSDLAYGPTGTGGVIGPDATLIFEVELLDIP